MDFWSIFVFFLLTFLIMSCCGYCCTSKRRGTVLSTPVVVTSATHTAPSGYVTQLPPPGYQANVYAAPYPVQTTGNVTVQMPMPQSMPGAQPPMAGMQTHGVAYPMPQPGAGVANMNPPPYDMAVSGGPQGGYEKQSPYNPTYPH
ncbi:protein shisa-5 isoform X4 [Scaptodrosophila lebanonensis]|uniref:Protein shisa-5 isoform X4 n=1 Tax=Drosophila lebanonensis TaxID=7225 RepID=A0A6J2U0C6_DROLE|nr:protein shisa-5 isoform X4 [Scaptodrosophila lebanonensis]